MSSEIPRMDERWIESDGRPTRRFFRYLEDAVQQGGASSTTEAAQDAVGAMVDSTLNYVDATPLLQRAALTGDVIASAGSNATTLVATAAVVEIIQDNVGTILADSGTIDFTYTDATPEITAIVKDSSITEAKQVLADNTTHDVSTTKHGYVPKAPNDATKFLNGVGAYAVPAGTGSSITEIEAGSIDAAATHVIDNIPSSYRTLRLVITNASCDTANRSIRVEASTDNGSTYFTDNVFGIHTNGITNVDCFNTAYLVEMATQTAANACSFTLFIEEYAETTLTKTIRGSGFYDSTNGWATQKDVRKTGVINALRLSWNGTGSFDGGTFALYGIT